MGGPDNRNAERATHVSIINYAYPSFKSRVQVMLFGLSRKLIASHQEKLVASQHIIEGLVTMRKNTAVTFDLSNKGIGICTTRPMKPGQKLLIYNTKWKDSPIEGTVRWCRRHTGIFFRVGLSLS
jgi:hypothetical protein